VGLTLTIDSYNMSELISVSNLTNFQGFSTGSRKPVDNPAALGASQDMRSGMGAAGSLVCNRPQVFILIETC
jgi:hypothetical protein